MPKSEVLLYSRSKFNATAIYNYQLVICKSKIYCKVLYELAILLTHIMKEYFNPFDDIQFIHTFSSISRDIYIVTLNEIHRYILIFMLYKMIYFSSHKFAFSNLRFSPFYEHFRQLCEKYSLKFKNKVHHVNQLIESDLMMYIHIPFSKSDHSTLRTPLTYSKYSSRR